VAQSNRLQPPPHDDYDSRHQPPSPPYRHGPPPPSSGARYPADPTAGPPYPAPYRGPPSDVADRRDYRDVPEYGRDGGGGYRGNGSLPRERPASAVPGYPPYASLSRAGGYHPPPPAPQYSNGSFNGPAVMMESPTRPGVNRPAGPDERFQQQQQAMSANQQYERVSE